VACLPGGRLWVLWFPHLDTKNKFASGREPAVLQIGLGWKRCLVVSELDSPSARRVAQLRTYVLLLYELFSTDATKSHVFTDRTTISSESSSLRGTHPMRKAVLKLKDLAPDSMLRNLSICVASSCMRERELVYLLH
jgi:hypothetical protein